MNAVRRSGLCAGRGLQATGVQRSVQEICEWQSFSHAFSYYLGHCAHVPVKKKQSVFLDQHLQFRAWAAVLIKFSSTKINQYEGYFKINWHSYLKLLWCSFMVLLCNNVSESYIQYLYPYTFIYAVAGEKMISTYFTPFYRLFPPFCTHIFCAFSVNLCLNGHFFFADKLNVMFKCRTYVTLLNYPTLGCLQFIIYVVFYVGELRPGRCLQDLCIKYVN